MTWLYQLFLIVFGSAILIADIVIIYAIIRSYLSYRREHVERRINDLHSK